MAEAAKVQLGIGNEDVEELLLWRDIKKSGIVFGSITVAYLLLQWSGLSLLTITANALLLIILTSFLWANVGSMINKPGPPVPAVFTKGITDEDIVTVANAVKGPVNSGLAFFGRLAAGKELKLSMMAAAVCYVLAKLGGWFSILGLLYTVAFVAFTIPKLYELRKADADKVYGLVSEKVKEFYSIVDEKVLQKIPKGSHARAIGTKTE